MTLTEGAMKADIGPQELAAALILAISIFVIGAGVILLLSILW